MNPNNANVNSLCFHIELNEIIYTNNRILISTDYNTLSFLHFRFENIKKKQRNKELN